MFCSPFRYHRDVPGGDDQIYGTMSVPSGILFARPQVCTFMMSHNGSSSKCVPSNIFLVSTKEKKLDCACCSPGNCCMETAAAIRTQRHRRAHPGGTLTARHHRPLPLSAITGLDQKLDFKLKLYDTLCQAVRSSAFTRIFTLAACF